MYGRRRAPQFAPGLPQEGRDVVAILVSAFYDDPTWSWAFPDPSLRAEQHRRLWGLFVDGAMRYPWVWLTPGNTATSVWIPPNGTDLSQEQEAALEPGAAPPVAPRLAARSAEFATFPPADATTAAAPRPRRPRRPVLETSDRRPTPGTRKGLWVSLNDVS